MPGTTLMPLLLRRLSRPRLRAAVRLALTIGIALAAGLSRAADSPSSGAPGPAAPPAGLPTVASPRKEASPEGGANADAAQLAFDRGVRLFSEAQAYAKDHAADHEGAARRYREAAESFAQAWKAGAATTEVFTNAAHSYAFAGDAGKAILFCRRALAVEPANETAERSLAHLRATLPIQKSAEDTSTSILRSLFFWHALAFSTRRLVFSLVFPGAFVLLAISLWRPRPFRSLGILSLAIAAALLVSLALDALSGSVRREAVVILAVEGRLGGGLAYSPSHSSPFPPGTEVSILEERRTGAPSGSSEAWLRVRLLDGTTTWIPEGVTERVIP